MIARCSVIRSKFPNKTIFLDVIRYTEQGIICGDSNVEFEFKKVDGQEIKGTMKIVNLRQVLEAEAKQ